MNFYWKLRNTWHMPNCKHKAAKPALNLLNFNFRTLKMINYTCFLCEDNGLDVDCKVCNGTGVIYMPAVPFFKWLMNELHCFWWKFKKQPFYLIKHEIYAIGYRFWWEFLWLQPFRCNGNKGGWRTHFCDWLENKARSKERSKEV